jgi:hypothetical protein
MSDVKFPDFPDNPDPGGEGGGGDNVPYIPKGPPIFLSTPIVWNVGVSRGYLRFGFSSDGPIMRYNIIWSRPGREETDMRWVDPSKTSATEEYVINERPIPDTDYLFKVQAQSRNKTLQFRGPYAPYAYDYSFTGWVEITFHTPPAPSLPSEVKKNDEFVSTKAKKPNPFERVDDEVRVVRKPIVGKTKYRSGNGYRVSDARR